MTQLEKIILGLLVLYCCFMIFRIIANAGFFFLSLLLVLPPIIFRKKIRKGILNNDPTQDPIPLPTHR